MRDRLAPAASELGWQPRAGESELTGQLRGDLLRALGTLGDDADVQTRAAESFATHAVDANVLAAVVSILAHAGDEARYAEFEQRFRAARTPQEEQRYLLCPGRLPPTRVDRPDAGPHAGRRRADAGRPVRAASAAHERGRPRTGLGVRRGELGSFESRYGRPTACGACARRWPAWRRRKWERRVRAFFEAKKVNLGGKTLEQYLEQLHIVVRLREREAEALRAYLRR